MKSILTPTDFSEQSINAFKYALSIAKLSKSKVILLHVYQIPVVPADVPVSIDYVQLEKENQNALIDFEAQLRQKLNYTIELECIAKWGFVTDEINNVVHEKSIDLIVMGITGAGKLGELLIGSNSTSVIKNIDCPTLIVPINAKFKGVQSIALATDLEKIKHGHALSQIKKIIKLFNSKLMILNVIDPSEIPDFQKAVSGINLENTFGEIEHSFHLQGNNDIIYGINDFIDNNNIDMLIMLPKKHSLFSILFKESKTKKMAFHTHIPLLAIHE
jgi:nucleotide-binding universal stress UspA family protein